MADPQTRKLARQLVEMRKDIRDLQTVPQIAHSSIDDTALPVYDADGNLVSQLGKQADGTYGAPPLHGPIPPTPTGVSAVGGAGIVHVRWAGTLAVGDAPLDFDALEVLIDDQLAGAIPNRDGGTITIAADKGTRYVSARIRTLVPRHSAKTSPFTVSVVAPAESLVAEAQDRIDDAELSLGETQGRLDDAEQAVTTVRDDLTNVETVIIPGAVADLEAADAAAQTELDELDTRLTGIDAVGTGELASIRDALDQAQQVANNASSAAAAADQAASAASQAALEAAGIAASKGRVIIQDTEPTGEDRQAANIWIKPAVDDPDTDITETATTYVYLADTDEWMPTTSDDLAQAAQNALDAREAAQQAQQRAETAVSNAATAQSAAEAAQRTADEATTDAREAHNEAVAAQGDATEALEKYGPLDQRTIDAQTAADAAQARADAAYTEAASKLDESQVQAIADAAQAAAETAAAADATAKAEQTEADAAIEAARVAQEKADAAESSAALTAQEKADAAEAAAEAWAKAEDEALEARAAQDASDKADQALADAQAALNAARGEITDEIIASANGKNSITRSMSPASGNGVVEGDLWVQVDSAGDGFAQWYWDGNSWTPSLIKNEMMESLDVHKLQVTGDATMDSAVIDKLWVDGLVGKTATFNSLTVSSSGNLIPGARPGSNRGLTEFAWDEAEQALRAEGSSSQYSDEELILAPGEYMVEVDIKASVAGTRTYVGLLGGSDVSWNYRYGVSNVTVGTEWQHFAAGVTIPEGEGGSARARFLPAYRWDGGEVTTWYRNPTIRPMTGAVLIEDGAISAPKITFTEELSGEVARFMSTESKKLVVTEEALLNHATLIGKTVVDDINVTGKLIGTDGVFTGTVDFENVNITDQLLAQKVIAAGMVAGTPGGNRVVIDETGIVMYGVDANDVEYELVRIGPSDENLITAGDTTISPAGVQASSGDFEELAVGGSALDEILWPLPRGVVARGWNEVGGRSIGPKGETELGEITVPVENGRSYALKVEPLSVYLPQGGRLAFKIYIEKGFGGNSAPAPTRSSRLYRHVLWRDTGGDGPMDIVQGNWLAWEDENATEWRLLFSLEAYGSDTAGAVYNTSRPSSAALAVSVEDVGPSATDIMTDRDGSTAAPQPPPPAPKRYTKTYSATGTKTYNGDGSLRDSSGDVTQGLYGGGPSRFNRRGGWEFPSFTGDLSGADVEKIEMYIYMNSSWYSAGATVNPSTHSGNISNSLSTFTSVYNWKRGTGKWITLPKSLYAGFKSGTYKGIGVKSTNNSTSQYAIFKASGAKIRITYVK